MLYTPEEQHLVEALYIESIIVKDKYKELKPKALHTILANFEALVGRVCEISRIQKVYGVAVSEKGERLMQQLGFRLIHRAVERSDQHPLHVAAFDDIMANIKVILTPAPAQRSGPER